VQFAGGGAFLRRQGADAHAPIHLTLSVGEVSWELLLPVTGSGVDPNHGEAVRHNGAVLLERPMFSSELDLGSERRAAGDTSGLRLPWEISQNPDVRPLVDWLSGVRVYPGYWLNQVREPQSGVVLDQYLHPTGKNVWGVLRNWKSAPKRHRHQFEWVRDALRRAFPDIFKDLELDAIGQTIQATFYPPNATTADEALPMDRAADGLLVGILHLTAVAGAKDGSVLAIEEMENHLHPHAIRSILASMRELADARGLTILLTTHSPVLMNEFKGNEERFYLLEGGHLTLPVALDEARDPDWLAHFSLGDLYDREDFGAPAATGSD
jgi:hypothetical protein